MKGVGFQYIFLKVSNLISKMTLAPIVKILNKSVWNFCMKKGGKLHLMLSIDHPTPK